MFLKRLSIALSALVLSGFVMGASNNTPPNATYSDNENSLLAPLVVTANLVPHNISCYGEDDGSLDISFTGGTAPYTWKLYNELHVQLPGGSGTSLTGVNFNFPNLSKGNYYVKVTDGGGADFTSPLYPINEPSPVSLNLIRLDQIKCTGQFGGFIFTANSDVADYTYHMRNLSLVPNQDYNNKTGIFSGLPEGVYSAWVIDDNDLGCRGDYAGTTILELKEPSTLDNVQVIPTQIACFGELGTALIANLPENTGADTYNIQLRNISTGSTAYSLTPNNTYVNLNAGNYELTVGRTGCPTVTKNFIIDPVLNITISETLVGTINCYGDKISLDVNVSGGKAGKYVYVTLDNNDGDPSNDPTSARMLYGSTHTFNEVAEGNYTVRCVDEDIPTCSQIKNISIPGPTSPLVYLSDPTGGSTTCFGSSDGKVQILVTGGKTPYVYHVGSLIQSIPANFNLAAGSYNVYVQDDNGCTTEIKPINISQPDALLVTHSSADDVDVTCPGGNDGEINMVVVGGSGGYKYDLTSTIGNPKLNVPTNPTINIGALTGGTYNVLVKDKNNCEALSISGIEIETPDPITISQFDLDTIKCYGETSSLEVKAVGGNNPLMTYRLYLGSLMIDERATTGVAIFSDLIPSSAYSLKIWSDLNCSDFLTVPFTVVSRDKLVIDNLSDSIMLMCSGDIPSLVLTVQGEDPFEYSIDGSPYVSFTGNSVLINAGLQSSPSGYLNRIIVKDNFDCENNIDLTIYEPLPLVTTDIEKVNVSCKSKNDGSISLNISGGTPGYTINVFNASLPSSLPVRSVPSGDGNVSILNIPAGTYNLVITDKNNCQAPNPPTGIVIEEPSLPLSVAEPVYDPILCYGGETSVVFTAIGGWDFSDKTLNVRGFGVNVNVNSGSSYILKSGTYTITATNTDGCSATRELRLSHPGKLNLTLTEQGSVTCNGFDDAKIGFRVGGGVAPYFYGLGGAGSADEAFTGNTFTIENIEATTYNLIVRDNNQCESNIIPVTISEPPVVTFDVKVDSLTCYESADGKITIQKPEGGNDNSYRTYINTVQKTFPIVSGLTAGTFDVYITDSKGCVAETQTVQIGQPDVITLESAFVSDSLLCWGDQNASITVEATGGLPYNLQYRLVGTSLSRSYQIGNVFNNLPYGEYEVFVRNSKGNCETKFPGEKIKILNPTQITVTKIDTIHVTCNNLQNGEAKIYGVGGTGTLNYFLTNAPPSIGDNPNNTGYFRGLGESNKSFTSYSYRIEDVNLCKKTGSFTIKNPEELVITEIDHHQVLCNNDGNGWIKVKVTGGNGGYKFYKNVGAAQTNDIEIGTSNTYTINKYSGGMFVPVVVDSKNCTDSLSVPVEIIDPEKIQIVDIVWGVKNCYGDMDDETVIHVTGGTPGYNFSLDNGTKWSVLNDSIFNGEVIGNKYPVVKDIFECKTAEWPMFYMDQPEEFKVNYEFTGMKCYYDEYGDMKLDIQGGTGPYTFGINDPTYISDSYVFPKMSTDVTTIELLKNDILLFPDITYKFYLKDANNCFVQNISGINDVTDVFADTIFTIPEKLMLTELTPLPIKCSNEKTGVIEFKAKLGNSEFITGIPAGYIFTAKHVERNYSQTNDPGSTKVNELFAGFYNCFLTDKNGCVAATAMTGFEYNPDSPDWGKDTTTIQATFDSVKVYISDIVQPKCDYWFDGSIEVDIENYRHLGVEYIVERWDSVEVRFRKEYDDWSDTISADPAYSNMDKNNELFYANSQKIVEDIGIGLYQITVRDRYTECEAIIKTVINSIDGDSCPPINYYNAFTPFNGDGEYDEWEIFGSEHQSYTLQIFTGFGELIYTQKGISDKNGIKWDGLDNYGRPAPVGTYIYLLRKFEGTPEESLIDGNITILRGNGR